jgi:mitochondrial chaperone BCS1
VILVEDIDCMKTGNPRIDPDEWARQQMPEGRNDKADPLDRCGVTLSGLLNVLDGFHASENVLFVMTCPSPKFCQATESIAYSKLLATDLV